MDPKRDRQGLSGGPKKRKIPADPTLDGLTEDLIAEAPEREVRDQSCPKAHSAQLGERECPEQARDERAKERFEGESQRSLRLAESPPAHVASPELRDGVSSDVLLHGVGGQADFQAQRSHRLACHEVFSQVAREHPDAAEALGDRALEQHRLPYDAGLAHHLGELHPAGVESIEVGRLERATGAGAASSRHDRRDHPDAVVQVGDEALEVIAGCPYVAVTDQDEVVSGALITFDQVVDFGIGSDRDVSHNEAALDARMLAHEPDDRACCGICRGGDGEDQLIVRIVQGEESFEAGFEIAVQTFQWLEDRDGVEAVRKVKARDPSKVPEGKVGAR